MRDFNKYSMLEWIRLEPLIHGFKQVRNDVIQKTFLMKQPKRLEPFLDKTKILHVLSRLTCHG